IHGPQAFQRWPERIAHLRGSPLSKRLQLSDDQVLRIEAIAREGSEAITKAVSFPINLDSKNGPPTVEAIRKFVESPEFQAAKEKARRAGRDARAAVMQRIEAVLTDEQRAAYHKMLGEAFDLAKLGAPAQPERQIDLQIVARAFGLGGGGQRSDP